MVPSTTGVRQGCILSPLLFAIAIDWVMHKVMEHSHVGIGWADGTKLADFDFADDIALLHDTRLLFAERPVHNRFFLG